LGGGTGGGGRGLVEVFQVFEDADACGEDFVASIDFAGKDSQAGKTLTRRRVKPASSSATSSASSMWARQTRDGGAWCFRRRAASRARAGIPQRPSATAAPSSARP